MWLAVDENGEEFISEEKPYRIDGNVWEVRNCDVIEVPRGTVERLLKYPLDWDNEAEEITSYNG